MQVEQTFVMQLKYVLYNCHYSVDGNTVKASNERHTCKCESVFNMAGTPCDSHLPSPTSSEKCQRIRSRRQAGLRYGELTRLQPHSGCSSSHGLSLAVWLNTRSHSENMFHSECIAFTRTSTSSNVYFLSPPCRIKSQLLPRNLCST